MYKLFTLKNGLRVVIESIDYVNSVSVGLWIENGSRNETKLNNGVSHFIEHMFFKGTSNRTSLQIAECIEDVGGQINAFTGKESTCFYIKSLDTHLNLALDVLADMLFNSNFSEEDIEKEKGVILEEINMSEDSPEDVLSDLHSISIWGEDPISLPILGTAETVQSFTREQITNYVESHYIPENSVISISGKIDMNNIEGQVERFFGQWNVKNKNITIYSSPKILSNHLFKPKSIEQLHISLGLPGIKTGDDRAYSLLLLSNIFGGGASSILFQKIREERGLCYSIYSYISTFNNTGVLSLYTSLNSKYAIDVISMINDELMKFAKHGISDEKLSKAKVQLKGNYLLGLESTSSRMFNNGKSVMFLNRINSPKYIIEKIDNINQTTLMEAMDITFKQGIKNSAFVGDKVDLALITKTIEKNDFAYSNINSKNI